MKDSMEKICILSRYGESETAAAEYELECDKYWFKLLLRDTMSPKKTDTILRYDLMGYAEPLYDACGYSSGTYTWYYAAELAALKKIR